MDKRFLLAIILSALVLVGTNLLFPTAPRTPAPPRPAPTATQPAPAAATTPAPAVAATPTIGEAPQAAATPAAAAAETLTVGQGRNTYRFVSPGAAPLSLTLGDFKSLRPQGGPMTLAAPRAPLFSYRLVLGADTVALASLPTTVDRTNPAATTQAFEAVHQGRRIRIENVVDADSFQVHVRGTVENAPANARLLVELPRGLESHEADVAQDLQSLAFSYKPPRDDPQGVKFSDLDSGQVLRAEGPMKWVALRNKYFVTAVIAEGPTPAFSEFRMTPGPEINRIVREASGIAVLPLAQGGRFELTLLAGPQKARLLQAMGHDLIDVNPYGGWLHGMVQPFATIVNNILLWLKDTTQLNYGWVLIIFGVLVRLLLWPLNQSAMRSSIKMQRLQPELQEIQKKYAKDPEKQREHLMKVYASHGMSPFSPMLGCLPMLLPMPVLFALYFVFQNTIEFRGVQFWWLQDISLKDPFYIIPVFMGLTMLLLSWIGMRGMPPNPQAKVMGYMMPAMMTLLFLNFPSGLNLYYAVQNVAAMPQQWLLTRERQKAGAGTGGGTTAKQRAPTVNPARR
ncbi:MAG TPA: membrane protein insertase YidC [Gemmatimonadaceae bacterium]|nr:membrane protein insertase YidC [Gemmatimonadaceae bacterium]